MEPLTSGRYPENMRYLVGKRLPEFTKQEAGLLARSCDFIGINYYTTLYAQDQPEPEPYNSVDQPASKLVPSYVTDANVNYFSKEIYVFQLFKLYMSNLLRYHILLLFPLPSSTQWYSDRYTGMSMIMSNFKFILLLLLLCLVLYNFIFIFADCF